MELWCTIFRMQFRKLKENRETDKQATPSLFPKTNIHSFQNEKREISKSDLV